MASVRKVKNGQGHLVSYRIEVKRTFQGQQLRWSYNMPLDPRKTARQNEIDAETIGIEAELDIRAGDHPQKRYSEMPVLAETGMTVGEWVARWWEGRRVAPDSLANERYHINKHILPRWGDVPLDDPARLSRLAVQRWVEALGADADLRPRSVRTIYSTFRLILNDALDEPSVPLDQSPCSRIRLPKPDPTGRRDLTPAEVAAICSRCGVHETLAWSLAFTGARVSDLTSRDVSHWSPLAGIQIPPAKRRRGQDEDPEPDPARRRRGAGKTPAAVRTIGLCGSHRDMLRTYVDTRRPKLTSRADGPLFVGARGQRVHRAVFWEVFVRAVEAAGVDDDVSPHWLRHTLNTWLQDAGCNQLAIDEHMGWTTPGVRGTYGHVTQPMRAAILAATEERWVEAHGLVADVAGRTEAH